MYVRHEVEKMQKFEIFSLSYDNLKYNPTQDPIFWH